MTTAEDQYGRWETEEVGRCMPTRYATSSLWRSESYAGKDIQPGQTATDICNDEGSKVATSLTKHELALEVQEITGIKPNLVKNVFDAMAQVAAEEIEAGEDFTVPGIVRITWRYRPPQTKGARWKKGDTVTGFAGIESVKDADSPPVKPAVTLKAGLTGQVGKLRPRVSDMTTFIRTKTAKAVLKRKQR